MLLKNILDRKKGLFAYKFGSSGGGGGDKAGERS